MPFSLDSTTPTSHSGHGVSSLTMRILLLVLGALSINLLAAHAISGTISSDTTWSGTVLIEGGVSVDTGVTLTINPGTRIEFDDEWSRLSIGDGGTLDANGTPSAPVTFTSAQGTPAAGDWRDVCAEPGSTASFTSCVFEYGGTWFDGMLRIRSSDVEVQFCTVRHSLQSGVQLGSTGITPDLSYLTITDCANAAIYQTSPNMSPTYERMDFRDNGRDTVYIDANSAHITTNVTWALTSEPFEVDGGLNIDSGGSLTIRPGVEVRFTDNNSWVSANTGSVFFAPGTCADPILFTSAASTPAPGDWRQITLDDDCTAFIRFCVFEYGGFWDRGMLRVYSSDTKVQHCKFRHSAQSGVQLSRRGSTPSFYGVTVTDCVDAAVYQDSGDMSPSYAAFDLRDNGHDTVYIDASGGHVLTEVTWDLKGTPIEVDGGLVIEDTGELTIEPGVEVQFTDDSSYFYVDTGGFVEAEGTPSQHVLFTSAQETPTPGDWRQIGTYDTGITTLRYCTLEYGGYWGQGIVYVASPSVTVDHCIIRYSSGYGIRVSSGYAPTLLNNSIFDNATYGVYNNSLGKAPVDARYHWWGDATGPYHEDDNPGGLGNAVSDGVLFDPWRSGPTEDADGDGLTNAEEGALGTNPIHPDSDGDGLPDGYEVGHGLDPQSQSDGFIDTDEDGLSNIEEFLRKNDPNDADDPARVFYAATDGVDGPARGTSSAPWQTIGYSLAQMSSSEADPATLLLDEGTYAENVNLEPGVTIRNREDASVTVEGTMVGANGATIRNLSLTSSGAVNLLEIDAVSMDVRNVIFSGADATGIATQGAEPAASIIEDCSFNNLSLGIDIHDAIPVIRKSVFDYLDSGIVIRTTSAKQDGPDLGDATDPNSGYNTFGEVTGAAVINERGTTVLMENNDWETDEPMEIAAKISGPGDYEPYLGSGTGVTAGSLTCVVIDFHTEEPILDATIEVDSIAVTDNEDGVYLLSGLAPNTYTVTVSAPDHKTRTEDIDIGKGLVASLNFALCSTDPADQADVNLDHAVNAIDIQYVINSVLGLPVEHDCDLNDDEDTNAVDVQLVINATLGVLR